MVLKHFLLLLLFFFLLLFLLLLLPLPLRLTAVVSGGHLLRGQPPGQIRKKKCRWTMENVVSRLLLHGCAKKTHTPILSVPAPLYGQHYYCAVASERETSSISGML